MRRTCIAWHAPLLTLSLCLSLQVAVFATMNYYPLDVDSNDDGKCPVDVNSGGGIYIKNGQMEYTRTASGDEFLYEFTSIPLCRVHYEEYNMFSQSREVEGRGTILGYDTSEADWVVIQGTGWFGDTVLDPGEDAFYLIGDVPEGEQGPYSEAYSVFESKRTWVDDSGPYPSVGQGFGWIHTGNL